MVAIVSAVFVSLRNFLTICRQRPQDAFAFTFTLVAAVLTYFYGTYQLIPVLLAEYPEVCLLIATVITTWALLGVLSNLVLLRLRDSSINHRMLLQPLIKPSPCTQWDAGIEDISEEQLLKERTRYMGQQFMARPFGEDEPWHICAACEVYVPPRAWHCAQCKICILRRDHHCVFAMGCIGEENHANFMGLLFYLGFGTSLATIVSFIYTVYFTDAVWWMFFVKAFVPFYVLIFDFSIINLLSGINLLGQFAAWGMFLYYLWLASKGLTSADKFRGIDRTHPARKQMGYINLRTMLGPNPFMRIVWPFHRGMKVSYGMPRAPVEEERKGL